MLPDAQIERGFDMKAMSQKLRLSLSSIGAFLIGLFGIVMPVQAQEIGANCTASIMNRTVQVNANGTFAIPDVPVDRGSYRVRITCKEDDGTVRTFLSDFQ